MVNRCVVCRKICSKGSGKSMHRMPGDKTRRKLWIDNLKLKTLTTSKWLYVCSDHFCDEDFVFKSGKKVLKAEAIPSRISLSSEHLSSSTSSDSDIMEKANVISKITFPKNR